MNLPPHLYTEGREAYLQSLQGIKEQLEEKGISVLDAFELAKDALGRGKDAPFTPKDLENMQAYSDLGAETGVYNPGDIPPLSQAIYSGPVFTTPKRDGQSVTYQYEDDYGRGAPRQIDLSNVHPSNREFYQDLLEGQAAYAAAKKQHDDRISAGLALPELSPGWVRASLESDFPGMIDPSAWYGEIDEGRDRGTLSAQDLGLRGDETEWDLYFNALQPGYQKTYDYDAQGEQIEAEDRAKAAARAAYDWQALGPGDISDPTIRSVQGMSWAPTPQQIIESRFKAQQIDPLRDARVTVGPLANIPDPTVTVEALPPPPVVYVSQAEDDWGWGGGGESYGFGAGGDEGLGY